MNLSSLLFPALIVLLIVPLLLNGRRQKREMEAARQMQGDLTEGDVVTTTSGLRATVTDASYEDTIDLEIAPGVVTTWLRAAVRDKVKQDGGESSDASGSSASSGADDHDAEAPTGDDSRPVATSSSPVTPPHEIDSGRPSDGATAADPAPGRPSS